MHVLVLNVKKYRSFNIYFYRVYFLVVTMFVDGSVIKKTQIIMYTHSSVSEAILLFTDQNSEKGIQNSYLFS